MRQPERDLLATGAAQLGLELSANQLDALMRLVDALESANAHFNLTAIRDRTGMLQKHVLDSFTAQPYLDGERIADVGTGAGFPGLPLAIINPARHFTLIESVGKKANFVASTAEMLGCANVAVVRDRAENYRPSHRFNTVLARALTSIEKFIAYAGHLCAPGGRLLAMKGKLPREEMERLPRTFAVHAVHRVAVPGMEAERHIVELRPTKSARDVSAETRKTRR